MVDWGVLRLLHHGLRLLVESLRLGLALLILDGVLRDSGILNPAAHDFIDGLPTGIGLLLTLRLHGHLTILSAHVLVEVVRPTHLLLLVVSSSAGLAVEMAVLNLVDFDLFKSVEPLVARDDVVVCAELRLEAAEVHVVLLELVLLQLAEGLVFVAAEGALLEFDDCASHGAAATHRAVQRRLVTALTRHVLVLNLLLVHRSVRKERLSL